MKRFRNLSVLLLLFVLSIGLVFADAKANNSKLDPMLRMLSQKAISVSAAKTILRLQEAADREPSVKTIVRFKENLNGVESLGGKIGSMIGDVATVDIPLISLEALSALENILSVEASKKVKLKLDISVPETGAKKLRKGDPPAWKGITGENVIIGVVDSGIDLSHPDFKDATGKTRILYLLDQKAGEECTKATIDNGTCYQKDREGHGTHVAGIAAGNGRVSTYRYVGMAPEANLIVVKTDPELDFDNLLSFQSDVLDGISYIQQKAAFLGRPCVVNLSLGGEIDPHDGTSNFSRGLDNASGAGKIIVGSAGNEADGKGHASGYVDQGSQIPKAFDVSSEAASDVAIDVWYSGKDSMDVKVQTPSCGNTGWIEPGETKNIPTGCGNISISSNFNNPNNEDKEILIILKGPLHGRWELSLRGRSVTNRRFDAWMLGDADFVDADSSISLDDVACTTRVISVGSYVTRPLSRNDPSAGNISTFSSHGPRRLCGICNNVLKPDIAAPGEAIISALSADYTPEPGEEVVDLRYIAFCGTSMASPHVAGAVALMLQKNPKLTPEDIKQYFSSTTKVDQYTGSVPNYIWGHGKLNVYDAFRAIANEADGRPDLTGEWIIPLSQSCKGIKKGEKCKITGTLTVQNNGDRNAPSSTVKFYLSDDGEYNEGDTFLKQIATGIVKAGGSQVEKFSYSFPLGETASGKYIIAIIDAANSIEESDEENNIIVFGPI